MLTIVTLRAWVWIGYRLCVNAPRLTVCCDVISLFIFNINGAVYESSSFFVICVCCAFGCSSVIRSLVSDLLEMILLFVHKTECVDGPLKFSGHSHSDPLSIVLVLARTGVWHNFSFIRPVQSLVPALCFSVNVIVSISLAISRLAVVFKHFF